MGTAAAAPRAQVLVVDDDPLIRRLLRLTLGAHTGLEVVAEASDGRRAVALAIALSPDVVVLDLAMPELDGYEAAAAIRAALPDCAILMFSAVEAERAARRARAAGVDAYVEKTAGMAAVTVAVAALAGR